MTYEESLHWGLNPGPYAYEAHALPLSYRGCWRNNLGMVSVWLKDYHVAGMLNIAQDHEWPSAAIPCGVAVTMVGAAHRFESGACARPYSICASMSRYLATRAHHNYATCVAFFVWCWRTEVFAYDLVMARFVSSCVAA